MFRPIRQPGGTMSEVAAPSKAQSVVRPMLLSHGTLMCKDLAKSRRFYEEFLGLEVVRHARPAMMLRLRTGMYVVAVCIGENIPNQHVLTHWGLNVATREEVDRAHADAVRLKDEYGIKKINKVLARHGAYGFYFQDLDNNWWEIQHEPRTIDDFYKRGDILDMSVQETDTEASHE
jgi:catechol 2,3-dioxygenase-like lactoylglutathione lyase family enzyme